MPRRNLGWLLGIVGLSLFCWAVAQGSLAPPRGPLQFVKAIGGGGDDYEQLGLLVDILQLVEQNYVHELSAKDRRKFIEQAIEGGLRSLDPHSGFMTQREYQGFRRQSDGAFGGVGIQINADRETKRLIVISPIVGTPAYKAGVKPGDEIEKINGEPTQGITQDEAVDKIQGPPGSQVTLTIRHRGADHSVDMTLTRATIEIETVLGDLRDAGKHWDFMLDRQNRIGYLRLVLFNQKSLQELKAALDKLEEQNLRGLILDLRGNPGGLLESAVAVSDLFLSEGKIVSVEGRTHATRTEEAHQAGTRLLPAERYPMVVLVNEGSASASEIVAAALQDHKRAVIVGERSFGKGSVQNLVPMEGGKSALKVTTAKYIRPNGKNIHRFPESKPEDDWGVRPDIEVKLSPQEELEYLLARRDRDIVRDDQGKSEAVERLARLLRPVGHAAPGGPMAGLFAGVETVAAVKALPRDLLGNPIVFPKPFSDRVLDRALDHLRAKLRS